MYKRTLFSPSSHMVTFTHLACSWRFFSWACLSKLASCPCVEHAHQTSSTLPVWHMHARHVQWHPHNKLATERINFPVHYSTDVCFNFFLMERLWYSIIRQKASTGKVKNVHHYIRIFRGETTILTESLQPMFVLHFKTFTHK